MNTDGKIFTDVMIDIETTHTMPDRGGILQIAAVRFNLDTKQVDHDFFNRCLTIPPHRHWSESTREWWLRQKQSVLKDILSKQEDYKIVIEDLAIWAAKHPGLRFWAKPTTFDYSFISSYFVDQDLIMPWHFRDAVDVNSFLKGLHYPNEVPKIDWRDLGDAHNALNDTLMQLQWVFDHVDYKKKGIKEAEVINES